MHKIILKKLNVLLGNICIFFITIYQKTLSPDKGFPSLRLKGKVCVHEPHCSQYGIEVLKRFGFIPGILKTMQRVSVCHPRNENRYDPPFYKIIFFSGSPIGENFLETLFNDKNFEISGVVTAPDKPVGRGQKIQKNPIKLKAEKLGIKNIFTPEKISPKKSNEGKEFYEEIKQLEPDFIVVIAYGKILTKSLINLPKKGCINVHGSILPKYRGASPIQSMFLNDEKVGGITVMLMNEKMDEGDMLDILKTNIDLNSNSLDFINWIKNNGPKFLNKSLKEYGRGDITPIEQNHEFTTYCKKINKIDGKVDIYNDSLYDIFNKHRGYYLWPKIWFEMDESFGSKKGKIVIIEKLTLDSELYEKNKKYPLIQDLGLNKCIKDIIVKPEGKKNMTRVDFQKGYMNNL